MGQAVDRTSFEHRDYARFKRQLAGETALLHDLAERDALSRAMRRWRGSSSKPG